MELRNGAGVPAWNVIVTSERPVASKNAPRSSVGAGAAPQDLIDALTFCAKYARTLQGQMMEPGGERPGIPELETITTKAAEVLARYGVAIDAAGISEQPPTTKRGR
mgnify:CR=1 FL=1